mgnify:FL=1
MNRPFFHTLVNYIIGLAIKIMPTKRSDWALAMMAESKYLSNDLQALGWALGCLKTATMERIKMMKTGTLRVSKTILSLEVFCCFIPVSLVFTQLIYAVLTVLQGELNAENLYIWIFCALTLIGPIGIFLGIRLLLKGPFRIGNILKSTLSILAIGAITAGMALLLSGNINLSDWWLVLLLICLLPAMTIFHLIYLTQNKQLIATQ